MSAFLGAVSYSGGGIGIAGAQVPWLVSRLAARPWLPSCFAELQALGVAGGEPACVPAEADGDHLVLVPVGSGFGFECRPVLGQTGPSRGGSTDAPIAE